MHTTAAHALRRVAQLLRLAADTLDPPILTQQMGQPASPTTAPTDDAYLVTLTPSRRLQPVPRPPEPRRSEHRSALASTTGSSSLGQKLRVPSSHARSRTNHPRADQSRRPPMTHTTPRRILQGALIFLLSAATAAWRELQAPRGW
jgi:hypothetical protein